MIFYPHAALIMCSNAHLPRVNGASAHIIALPENKASCVQNAHTTMEISEDIRFATA